MRVAAVQHDIVWEDPAANHARLAPKIAAAAEAGARLVALAEMYATGFSPAAERIVEPPDGPSTAFLVDQAAAHGVWVCGSLAEQTTAGARPTNTLVLAGPGGEVHRYAKIHLFGYAGEDERFAPGAHPVTVTVDDVRVSLHVCYDLRFAPDFWAAAPTTDCYVVVANWPDRRREHWRTLLRARAVENQAYVVGVNRVGPGGGLDYAGDSAVIGPFGEECAVAVDAGPRGAEEILVADVDPAHVADTRARFPFLRDR